MTPRPARESAPQPAINWTGYEEVTSTARRAGIKYVVLLDPQISQRLTSGDEEDRCGNDDPLAVLFRCVLVPLAFLLGRFESMLQFRFSAGPKNNRIPILATFHHNDEYGYFVALTYEPHSIYQ